MGMLALLTVVIDVVLHCYRCGKEPGLAALPSPALRSPSASGWCLDLPPGARSREQQPRAGLCSARDATSPITHQCPPGAAKAAKQAPLSERGRFS